GRNEKRLRKVGESCQAIKTIVADLGQRDGRDAIVREIHCSVPNLIINCAGFGLYGDAIVGSTKAQLNILEVNGVAPLELTLEGAKALQKNQKRGVILNISSMAGEFVSPGVSVYGASKAFLTRFSQAVDFELRSSGIRVLASLPGMVATDFANRAAARKVRLKNPFVMNPQFVARQIYKQIMTRKRVMRFHWPYRVSYAFTRLFGFSPLIQKIIYNNVTSRL
ncbi:MAG: SDR family NAD(P)-dependent oxidoreductase, partial [Chlamydiales bacterium]